jgi:predicted SAM-dependent methyltransferase
MKLHIGCGNKYLPGFKHMDAMSGNHIDYVCDARHLTMIDTDSVNEIYACHILEHVGREDVLEVLKEWNRVLKPKGIIRIAVPDFESIVKEYIKNPDLSKYLGLLYGGQNYEYNFHYITFDFSYMKNLLQQAGFDDVERYDWQTFLPENYDDFSRAYIPHMDFKNGRLMSLNVIANKV